MLARLFSMRYVNGLLPSNFMASGSGGKKFKIAFITYRIHLIVAFNNFFSIFFAYQLETITKENCVFHSNEERRGGKSMRDQRHASIIVHLNFRLSDVRQYHQSMTMATVESENYHY